MGNEAAADDLPELHATLSGMKAMGTVWAHESIEECRKCCGGQVIAAAIPSGGGIARRQPRRGGGRAQGFLMSSGIAKISPDFAEWVTVEGEQVRLLPLWPVESTPHHTLRRHRRRRTARSRLLKAPNVAAPAPCHGQRRGAVCKVCRGGSAGHPIATACAVSPESGR